MQTRFILAASLLVLVGLVHTVLGEVLIFRRLRTSGLVPTAGRPLLAEAHLRILWCTWHLATVLAWGLAAVVWRAATASPEDTALGIWVGNVTGLVTLASACLVFFSTRGRHPAWLPLLAVAALVWWR